MYIRKATEVDVHYFLWHLSADDVEECKANYGTTQGLSERLLSHLSDSSVVLTNAVGEIYAYGGNFGDCVWFLTSSLVDSLSQKHKEEFRQCIIKHRDLLLTKYPTLWNFVWEGNESHIRFLKSIGAKFHDDKWTTSVVTGEVFHLFTISKE